MIPGLLTWFVDRRRNLPWRRVADPYATWVSEIMLQQTRVEAVIPYFERWMARFPDVHALARASEEEVLQHWAGLGYYRRARFLHQAAFRLVKESNGELPRTSAELQKMTGVGEYTSAAIASICFDEAIPVVDGNVKRVAARVLLLDLAANDRKLHRAAEEWGRELMADLLVTEAKDVGQKSARAGALNEALMELGATICTPRSPLCGQCPIQAHCLAEKSDVDPADYPRSAKRTPWQELYLNFVWHQDGPLCLLEQRTKGWNPGLWEPPTVEQGIGEEICQVKHTITHHKITARVFKLRGPVSAPLTPPDAVPLTGLARKILAMCWKAC